MIDFRTEPSAYRHWRLNFAGPVATLAMDVDENGGLAPGYELKLNSYDLGVDIELNDAVQSAALRASRNKMRDRHVGQGARVLRRREYQDAWPVEPSVQSEFLQIYE